MIYRNSEGTMEKLLWCNLLLCAYKLVVLEFCDHCNHQFCKQVADCDIKSWSRSSTAVCRFSLCSPLLLTVNVVHCTHKMSLHWKVTEKDWSGSVKLIKFTFKTLYEILNSLKPGLDKWNLTTQLESCISLTLWHEQWIICYCFCIRFIAAKV